VGEGRTKALLSYGGVPVPYAVSWSAEDGPGSVYLGKCPHAQRIAIRQRHARGQGKPRFGSPHMDRQREVITLGLCDLCARSLKNRTKVSLSQARPQTHAATIGDVLQFEPLLHKECAAESMKHCPSLRRQASDGSLHIRQVTRYAVQFALYSAQGTFEATGERRVAVSHAKVQLIKWIDRHQDWLGSATPAAGDDGQEA
jgi:hypothetical protein